MKRRSIIWFLAKEELKNIVKNSDTITVVLKHFNLSNKGGNYKTLQKRLIEEEIDFSHIKLGLGSNKGRKGLSPSNKLSLESILIENSSYNRDALKKRLINMSLLENKCNICGQLPEWNSNFTQVGKLLGVSDNAIRKRLEKD